MPNSNDQIREAAGAGGAACAKPQRQGPMTSPSRQYWPAGQGRHCSWSTRPRSLLYVPLSHLTGTSVAGGQYAVAGQRRGAVLPGGQ